MPGLVTVGYLHPGEYKATFAESLIQLLFYDAYGSKRITGHAFGTLPYEAGSGAIPDGRNEIARRVLDDTESDWLWFVDTDMGFAPDTVDRLVESADPVDRPVMGGLAFAQKKAGAAEFLGVRYRTQPTILDYADTGDDIGFVPRFDYERDTVTKVSATGAACLLIHRSALHAVREAHGPGMFDTIRHPGGRVFSEDLAFCVRLASCGIPVHVNTAVKTSHAKGGVYLDEAFYDRERAA